MAREAYLFRGRSLLILLRILLHRDNYQFITPLLSIYTFITSSAASMVLKLSVEGARGHCRRKELVFLGPWSSLFLASAPSSLLLEAVSSIRAPSMCSALTGSEPQPQPGDHLTGLPGGDFMCTRPPTGLPVGGLPAPRLLLLILRTSSGQDSATNFTIQRAQVHHLR